MGKGRHDMGKKQAIRDGAGPTKLPNKRPAGGVLECWGLLGTTGDRVLVPVILETGGTLGG